MDFKKIVSELEKSEEFKEWKKTHKDSHLVHIFFMDDEANKDSVQIGYYTHESNTVSTFIVKDKDIQVIPDAEIFREEHVMIQEINLDEAKISLDEATRIADELQKKEYSAHLPIKKIILLQNLGAGIIWNITFVTRSFMTLNIKLNAIDGKVISHQLISLVNVEKKHAAG